MSPSFHKFRRGFSLMECLMLVAILGIVGASAGGMLQAIAKTPAQSDREFQVDTALVSTMEYLRSRSFDQLALGSPSSVTINPVVVQGQTYTPTVNIILADADRNGSVEANFKQITVQLLGHSVSTLVTKP